MSSLNIGPESKYRQLAWRLLAIIPDIDAEAYELSDKELVYRRMELHNACIQIIVGQLQTLSEGNIMISVGGRNIPMRILLAAIINMLGTR